MRYFYIFFVIVFLSACVKKSTIEIQGITRGIRNGTVIIKNDRDSVVYDANIKKSKFTFNKPFDTAGYFTISITEDKLADSTKPASKNDEIKPFEIYLEKGQYTIGAEAGKVYTYPKITSSSKTQNQLSKFHLILDSLNTKTKEEAARLNEQLNKTLPTASFNALLTKLSLISNAMENNTIKALIEYVKEHPDNDIGIHLMDDLHYGSDPVSFYSFFKMLPPALRNCQRGTYLDSLLSHLVRLMPGAKAPEIYGKTIDGKPFSPNMLNDKFILIDFWRSSSELSRMNHQKLITMLSHLKNRKEFGILSVSFDSDPDVWAQSVKDDQMNWMEVSDLKGQNSPNISNWMITRFPTYYLLDEHWKIIKRDLITNNMSF